MCRLFGQHAHPGRDVAEPLCTAPNALRLQSHRHPHGWGIGWYDGERPLLRRGILPAHQDEAFARAAAEARSPVVLAHVRERSVGEIGPDNCHPFTFGRWLFAHNGTVARFAAEAPVREAIEAEIDADLRARFRGTTDSERVFYLFLSALRARTSLDAASVEAVCAAFRETTEAVLGIADRPGVAKPTSLNLLVSDGRLLAACRHGRTLHLAAEAGPQHAFVIASEPIGEAARWEVVPEGGFAATEDGARVVRDVVRAA